MSDPNARETWMSLARDNWPGISDEDVEFVLWNATCFPFGTSEQVAQNLREMYARSNGNPEFAAVIAEHDLSEEMKKYREEQKKC